MKQKEYILGVTVTNRSVLAVLVHDGPEGPVALRQFSRPRSSSEMMAPAGDIAPEAGADPDVAFGGDDPSIFLPSEFSLDEPAGSGSSDEFGHDSDAPLRPSTVEIELTDILADCAEAGFPDVATVFCVNSTDLGVQILEVPSKGKKSPDREPKKRKGAQSKSEKDRLNQLLVASAPGRFDPELTSFHVMTPSEAGHRRELAVYARLTEPVVATLKRLADRNRELPAVHAVDTEFSILTGLARLSFAQEQSVADAASTMTSRMIVRVGAEDTVVLFMENRTIKTVETLRSITVYDSPDTVSSRILLLQDEYDYGEADEIYVLGEDHETALIERFKNFFPESHVRSLRAVLPEFDDEFEQDHSREAALAAGAALRAVSNPDILKAFDDIDLLPKRLVKRRRVGVSFQWQIYALLILLFSTTLFFMARYFTQRHQREMLEYQLSQYTPAVIEGNVRDLQARIDSMQNASASYIHALDVLDSLLIGSDRWSRVMERTAREAAAVPGIWIETWQESGNSIELIGNATHRDQVVRLAARMDGVIQSLSFSEIRDWPVYSFEMSIDVPRELPEAARYLREQVALNDDIPAGVAWSGDAASATSRTN